MSQLLCREQLLTDLNSCCCWINRSEKATWNCFVRCFLIFAARHTGYRQSAGPNNPIWWRNFQLYHMVSRLAWSQPCDCNLVGGVWYLVSVYTLATSSFYWLFSHTQKNNINRGEFRTNFLDCFLVCFMIFFVVLE